MPNNIRENSQELNLDSGLPADLRVFGERTGAHFLIQGSYYMEGKDSLLVNSWLMEAPTGELVVSFRPIRTHVDQKVRLAEELSSYLQGFWASKDLLQPIEMGVPRYEAYQAYLRSQEYFGIDYSKSIALLKEAYRLDTNFFWPYISMVGAYSNMGEYATADSLVKAIAHRRSEMTELQRFMMSPYQEGTGNTLIKEHQVFYKFFELDPKDIYFNYLAALTAVQLNAPKRAIDILDHIDDRHVDYKNKPPIVASRLGLYATAQQQLGQHAEALKKLDYFPTLHPVYYPWDLKIRSLARLGQWEKVEGLISELGNRKFANGHQAPFSPLISVAVEAYLMGDQARAVQYARQAREYYLEAGDQIQKDVNVIIYSIYQQAFILEDWDQTIQIGSLLTELEPDDPLSWGYLGCAYAASGQIGKAEEVIQYLQDLNRTIDYGRTPYYIGCIQAQLGREQAAMKSLQRAFEDNCPFSGYYYQWDIFLSPLLDRSSFQEFIAPETTLDL
jgi:tetratricopeptide (TPR) repeat protein